jgi:hypothetical protein
MTAPAAGPLAEPARTVLVVTSVCAVAAAVLGTVVVPGLRGNAGQETVEVAERISGVLSFGVGALLVLSIAGVALGLARRGWPVWPVRVTMVTGALLVAAASLMAAAFGRLDTRLSVVLSLAGEGAVVLGSALALRRPHTRAAGAVLLALALASAARLSSWELASQATEQASVPLYAMARVAATTALLLEAAAQVVTVAWVSRRAVSGGWAARAGSVAAAVAIAVALAASYAAMRGAQNDAPLLDLVLHTAFDRPTTPPAYLAGVGLTIFLGATALALAGAALVAIPSAGAPAACLALALVSGGAFDVPLRALAAAGATCFLVLAASARPLPPGFRVPVAE